MSQCNGLPTVRVIKKGFLIRKGREVERSSSTVTLVEIGSHRVVVDTGDIDERDDLASAFEANRIPLESVDMIINTHLHRDHFGGNDLFPSARMVAHEFEEPPIGSLRITEETILFPGISVVPTPGHTRGSISVFVEGRRRCVMAGDALPTKGNYDNHTPPSLNIDPKLAIKSMDAILAWADVVVPGHDALFEVMQRDNKA